jgi:exodeoxyribonuclease VII large subunit
LLNAYSPLQILSRGYTLTYKDGLVVKDCTMLNVDDELDIRFNKGIVKATVKEKYNDK